MGRAESNGGPDGHDLFGANHQSRSWPEEFQAVAQRLHGQARRPDHRRQGKCLKRSNAGLFASIQKRYGVPPGPLLAIWGMETGFGSVMGNQNTLSAVATLAYDCRRSEYFTGHLYAALTLIDRGVLSSQTRGAMHGEVGHTQFLPRASCFMLSTATVTAGLISIRRLTRSPPPRTSSRVTAGRPAPAISRANAISRPSKAGTRPASISRRLPSSRFALTGADGAPHCLSA